MVDVTQIFPVSEAGGEFLDRGPHNSDELSSSQFKRPDPKQNKDITLLEGAASWLSAALSPFSLLLVGERLPMYKNSNASNTLDGVEKLFRIPEKFYLKKGVETFHSGMKNLINIPIALANVGLTIFNGSSLPLFKDTSVSKAVSYIGDKLQKGWKALEGGPYIGKLAKGVAWLNTKKNNIINSKATRNVLAVSLGLLLLGTGLIGIAVVTIAAAVDITKGALDVNKTKVLIDELNHLRSIKASQDKLTEDQKKALKAKYNQGKEATTSRNELSLAIKNTGPAVMLQAPLAVATVLNPANALMLSELGGAALAAFGNKFTEESARAAIQAEIASLRENTGVSYDQTKSRKYDLANMAKDYADKAGVNDQTYKVDSKLFSDDKINEPKSLGDRAFKAMKSSFFCVIDYVNPLKEPTSCVKFVVKENEEWQKQQEASSSSSVKSNGKQQIQRSPSVAVSSTSRNVLSTNEVKANSYMSVVKAFLTKGINR